MSSVVVMVHPFGCDTGNTANAGDLAMVTVAGTVNSVSACPPADFNRCGGLICCWGQHGPLNSASQVPTGSKVNRRCTPP